MSPYHSFQQLLIDLCMFEKFRLVDHIKLFFYDFHLAFVEQSGFEMFFASLAIDGLLFRTKHPSYALFLRVFLITIIH